MSTPAPACRQALADATRRWPRRSRASDGILGDARHQRRKSDHNLGNAVDITHDPKAGCDAGLVAALAIRDSRVTYVIWNRRIYSRSRAAEGWRQYRGSNPHTAHCHISIRSAARADTRPWAWASLTAAPRAEAAESAPPPPADARPPARPKPLDAASYPNVPQRMGARGALVRRIQEGLARRGWRIDPDGVFGAETDRTVRDFQRRKGLLDDGVVGRRTWTALFA